MPKVSEDYERKTEHLGIRLTEANKRLVADACKAASGQKGFQGPIEGVVLTWAKRILRHKRNK